jgi:FMN phosphatase YigB (HAD superfamily)
MILSFFKSSRVEVVAGGEQFCDDALGSRAVANSGRALRPIGGVDPHSGIDRLASRTMTRARLVIAAVLIVLFASACQVDTTVDVTIDEDGSGRVGVTIAADSAAVSLLTDDPTSLIFDDLTDAGWEVTGPLVDDGGITLTASKAFLSPTELSRVLGEILGDGLLFTDVSLEQEHEFSAIGLRPATTSYDFIATVDPAPDLELLGDDGLAAVLDQQPLGRPLLRIETDAGVSSFSTALRLTLNVTMPSGAASGSGEVIDDTVTWTFAYGDPATQVDATASVDDILPRVWALIAIIASILFVLVVVSQIATFVVAKLRTPKGRRRRDQRQRAQRAATREAEANRPRRRLLRLLIVDVHGVIVRPSDPVEGLLIPLITAERPGADPERIRHHHRQLTLGRSSPEEFWSEVGLGPMADEIETRYLSSFRLVPGLHPFLDRMATARLPVAAIGNQPRVWGERLRRMASLEASITNWMVSGDVGSALPEPALFEATRRTMSVDLYDCFYLSNNVGHLDAARELGIATGLFVTSAEMAPETDHTIVRGFDDLLRSRGS